MAGLVLAVGGSARANGSWWEVGLELRGGYLRALPTHLLVGPPPDAMLQREIAAGTVYGEEGQSLAMAGFAVGTSLVVHDRWVVPMFGFDVDWSVGPSDPVVTSRDGTLVELEPQHAVDLGLGLPGFGARVKERRWSFQALVRPGVAILVESTNASIGGDQVGLGGALAASPSLRTELEGCRRIDPVQRLCLVGALRVYEFGWANGGYLALRWEVGP